MKNYIVYSLLIIVSLCACSEKYTLIQGNISSNKSEKLLLAYNNLVDTVLIDNEGFFKNEIKLESATYINLIYKRNTVKLYLNPGENIDVKFDADNNGDVIFSGSASKSCYYLDKQEKQNFSNEYYKLEENDFFVQTDKLLNEKQNLIGKSDLNQDFKNLEKERVKYGVASKVLNYPSYYPFYTNKEFVYGDTFLHYFDDLSFDNVELMQFKEYKDYIFTYIQWFSFKNAGGYNAVKQTHIGVDFVLKEVSSVKNRNYLLYKLISGYVSRNGVDNTGSFLSSFNSNCTDANYLDKVNKLVSKWEKIAKGKVSPSFNILDINGEKVTLESLKGKIVYIDIWATWCGPCRGEIPHLAKLEEEFHSKDIAFVSISVDKNKKAWEEMVMKDKLGGIQLHAGGNCSFVKNYMVNGIPRFILLDKEGRILNSNADRPSGKINQVLKQLLN